MHDVLKLDLCKVHGSSSYCKTINYTEKLPAFLLFEILGDGHESFKYSAFLLASHIHNSYQMDSSASI